MLDFSTKHCCQFKCMMQAYGVSMPADILDAQPSLDRRAHSYMSGEPCMLPLVRRETQRATLNKQPPELLYLICHIPEHRSPQRL